MFQAIIRHKIKPEQTSTKRLNIIKKFRRLFCDKMDDNRYYNNPFEDYPNSSANSIVNASTNEVITYIIYKFTYTYDE